MLKIYGSDICPDCVTMGIILKEEEIPYNYIDITESTDNLKEFLKLRDNNPLFAPVRENGGIGIPLQIRTDGKMSLDSREVLYEKYGIRKTRAEDLPRIMEIVTQAQEFLKENQVEQWQDGYPEAYRFQKDIDLDSSYVVQNSENRVIATITIALNADENYSEIQGEWHSQQEYGVVHRMAIESASRGKGLARQLLHFAEQLCRLSRRDYMRIDTHINNNIMRGLILKSGYCECGTIELLESNGEPKRIAYDKVLRTRI
ncbi:MAG: GNAT family N-acetyltransferase [Lachnospiraceae bacterium]